MQTHLVTNETATQEVAAEFAEQLTGGEVVELVGDLGAGKTTFVRGVARALGTTARVKSPSFTAMNEYPVNKNGVKRLLHLDLYRFNDASQLEALALEDEQRPDTVLFIEWPNVFNVPLTGVTHEITIVDLGDGARKIEVKKR